MRIEDTNNTPLEWESPDLLEIALLIETTRGGYGFGGGMDGSGDVNEPGVPPVGGP